MALNTLFTGLESRLGQLVRTSQPRDLLEAQTRIRRELQLSYLEHQKQSKPIDSKPQNLIRRPQISNNSTEIIV